MLEYERFQVVVSDIALPVLSGYDVLGLLRVARGASRTAVAIAVTGIVAEEARAEAIAAGFDAYSVELLQLADLFALIARLLKIRSATP